MSQDKIETIKINEVEYVRKDQLKAVVVEKRDGAWTIGKNYIVRTVTMMITGRLIHLDDHEMVFQDAAWVADSGRFADALKSGKLNEVEPFPDEAIIGRGSVVDAALWNHALPRDQK